MSLVLGTQVFIDNRGNFIEGAGADELCNLVVADDENGRLGGYSVFPGLLKIGGYGCFHGLRFPCRR